MAVANISYLIMLSRHFTCHPLPSLLPILALCHTSVGGFAVSRRLFHKFFHLSRYLNLLGCRCRCTFQKQNIRSEGVYQDRGVMATSCGAETMGKCVIGHGPLKLWTCREGLKGGKKGLGGGCVMSRIYEQISAQGRFE